MFYQPKTPQGGQSIPRRREKRMRRRNGGEEEGREREGPTWDRERLAAMDHKHIT